MISSNDGSIVLTVIFGVELIVTDWRSNVLAGIGLWCGLFSQLMLAVLMFSEIKKERNGLYLAL